MNLYEVISIILTSFLIMITLLMFVSGMIGIPLNSISVYIFVAISIAVCGFCFFKFIKKNLKMEKSEKKDAWTILTYAVLIVSNISLIVFFFTRAISTNLVYADEFSVWGLNAKNIFLGSRLTLFMNTGLENYPNFLPLLYSSVYFLTGSIHENLARGFASLFIVINLINMLGIAKRLKLDSRWVLFGNFLIVNFFSATQAYATSLYSEYAFLAMYTAGVEYLILYILSKNRKEEKFLLTISLINMIGTAWCRQEGMYFFAFNILALLIGTLFYKKLEVEKISIKEIIKYSAVVLIVPITWKIWTVVAHYPTELVFGAGARTELHLEYTVHLFQNMAKQFFDDSVSVVLLVLTAGGLVFNFDKLDKGNKNLVIFHILAGLFNFALLVVCYLVVFGEEALIAASFIRYLSRILMLNLIMIMILFHKKDTIKP